MTKQVPIAENEWMSMSAGDFTMGSPDDEVEHEEDEQQHEVLIGSFSMMKHTVTFAQYDAYCETSKIEKPDVAGCGRGNRPVILVNWHQALKFAAWMSQMTGLKHRLRIEAEWKYACRADTDIPIRTRPINRTKI